MSLSAVQQLDNADGCVESSGLEDEEQRYIDRSNNLSNNAIPDSKLASTPSTWINAKSQESSPVSSS